MARKFLGVVAAVLLCGSVVQAADLILDIKIAADGKSLKVETTEFNGRASRVQYNQEYGILALIGTKDVPVRLSGKDWEREFSKVESVVLYLKGTKKDPAPKLVRVPSTDLLDLTVDPSIRANPSDPCFLRRADGSYALVDPTAPDAPPGPPPAFIPAPPILAPLGGVPVPVVVPKD